MIYSNIKVSKYRSFIKLSAIFLLILIASGSLFAQYKGEPVKKDRLIKALNSRQLQTSDIVTIIKTNGVNFALTPETRKALIEAGARPEVLQAIDENLRLSKDGENLASKNRSSADYDDLIDQAIYVFKDKNNPQDAVQFLQAAVKIKPDDPAAFQMLGFVNLYGLKNLPQAKKYMMESVKKGGSAVFRVFHDDNGDFTKRCVGSLYVSPDRIRYESDDNIHTFESSTHSISKIKLDRESSSVWKKHPIFKVYLKIGNAETKFRFAPVNGKLEESKLAAQIVLEAKIN